MGLTSVATRRFYYGWVIVAVSYLSVFLAVGTRFSFGIFYVAILDEYGWSRAQAAGAFSVAMVVHAFFAPISGYLLDRFGARVFFPFGAALLSLGLYLASTTSSMLELYIYFGVIIAIGVNTMAYTPHMALITRWFMRHRGLASGMVLAGIGTGMMCLAPFIQYIINNHGWRDAFLVLSVITAAVLIPMIILFQRREPKDVGQFIDGRDPSLPDEKSARPRKPPRPEMPLKEVLKTSSFWQITIVTAITGMTLNTLSVHQAMYTVDAGYSPTLAASLVGLVGILGSVGGILGGSLSDRIGRAKSYTLSCLIIVIGILFLLLLGASVSDWFLYLFVLLYGVGSGAAPPTVSSKTGDLFGGKSIGLVMGLTTVGYGLGGALGAFGGGFLYDITGSYAPTFGMLVICQVIGILLFRSVKRKSSAQ